MAEMWSERRMFSYFRSVEPETQIRWMIRRDMTHALRIESASFDCPWSEHDLISMLRNRNCIGCVAEQGEQILGYMVYELGDKYLHLHRCAVCPDHRRKRVGTLLVKHLQNKLSPRRRNRLDVMVRETNLDAQLFFKNMGFRGKTVFRNAYSDTSEDAYLMRYSLYGGR